MYMCRLDQLPFALFCLLAFIFADVPARRPLSPQLPHTYLCRRLRRARLVVEVRRHLYGGRIVQLHSTVQLVNASGLPMQLGCLPLLGWGGATPLPRPLATLDPGGSLWLPLPVSLSAHGLSSFRVRF
jgi:hypothetical protein